MASIIKIKRSAVTATPTTLENGEMAYSEVSKKVFIGTTGGIEEVGGDFFTDLLNSTAGTLTASKAVIVDSNSKINQWLVDNITIDGNEISAASGLLELTGIGGVELNGLRLDGSPTITIAVITDEDDLDGGASNALATSRAVKAYVDSVASGLQVKQSVRAASAADVDLGLAADPNPVGGVTLANGDRVLLKEQAAPEENGIYDAVDATDPTTWVRSSDFDEPAEVTAGVFVFVEEGTFEDTGWVLTSDNPLTIGTDPLNWSQFSGAGSITAGDGLDKTGNTLDVVVSDFAGAGLENDGSNNLRIAADGVTNAMLANDSITVTAGTGLTGGGTVALGGSITLNVDSPVDVGALAGAGLVQNVDALDVNVDGSTLEINTDTVRVKDLGITAAKLAADSVTTAKILDGNVTNAKLANSSVTVTAGAALTGGGAVALGSSVNLDVAVDDSTIEVAADALRVKDGGITNAKLANDDLTVTAGSGLSGGGLVALGASITLNVNVDDSSIEINADTLRVKAAGVTNDMLAGSIANSKLANSTITLTGDTGSDAVALGETLTVNGTNGIAVDSAGNTLTIDLEEVDGGGF